MLLTNHIVTAGTKCISLFHQSDQPFIVVDQSHYCGHEIHFSPSPMRPPAYMFSTNPKHLGMKYIYLFPPIRTPVQQNLDQTDDSWHELPFSPQPTRPLHSMSLTNHITHCGRESTSFLSFHQSEHSPLSEKELTQTRKKILWAGSGYWWMGIHTKPVTSVRVD